MPNLRSGLLDLFSVPGWGETVRAFIGFGVLTAVLVTIGGDLAFRQLNFRVLQERVDLGQREAEEIAREVARMADRGDGIDYSQLRRNRDGLTHLIQGHIVNRYFIRHVEVRDRFGARLVLVTAEASVPLVRPPGFGGGWPALDENVIQVPLNRERPILGGEVRLGISQQALQQEVEQLGRSLRIKLAVAGAIALGLLVLALLYVLHLIRKNRRLEQARQSAARASYVGLLASGLAHEIRNPLNAMNINLQMLEEELQAVPDLAGTEHRELLDSTKSEIKRLERLVNNFLAFARPAQPRFEAADLNAITSEVTRFLEVDFRQNKVDLVADLEPLLPEVELDETQFKQALMNLLVNARQVMKGGGAVIVRTRAGPGGEVVLEVEDNGPGIPPEARERIFEVFYSSRGGGTGLGLPIAKQIIERHGGTIGLDSVPGRGTTFRIRLPRHQQRLGSAASA